MEIERKFLVRNNDWKEAILKSETVIQFYLTETDYAPSMRLRIKGQIGYFTLKYPSSSDVALIREEYEYEIPIDDIYAQMSKAKSNILKKTRHQLSGCDGKIWEIDEFLEPETNLIIAEIELSNEQENFDLPSWAGREVTKDTRYNNIQLAYNQDWSDLRQTPTM